MEIKSLKEIASLIRTGKTPPTKEDKYFNGEINWYSPGDLDKTKYLFTAKRTITQQAIEDKKAITFPKDTLLVGCIGDIGKLGITSELSSSNQQLTGILPNNETNVSYLYYWFKGNKKVLENYSNNAVVPILNNRTLETVKIPLPPLDQQKKIAAILDAADAYRQKTKALIDKYDQLTQSLFLDMFGDPVTNPKGWDTNELGEILEITSSKRIFKDEYVDEGIPFYRTKEIVELSKDNKISLELFISEKRYSDIKSKFDIPEKGDILLSAVGTIGIMWTVNTEDPFYFKDGNLVWLKSANLEGVDPTYLRMTLEHLIDYEKYKLAEGGAYNALTIAKLKEFKVLLAPYDLQNQFAERVQAIEAQKAQAQASLAQAEDLFHSLLQRAFKGELTANTSPAIDTF
jgi:type I restriction enzyme S subunit